ncbi:MAG: sigma-70 family RNA polymerase sigma factor [Bacteroidota bacterium]
MREDFAKYADVDIWRAFKQGNNEAFAHMYRMHSEALFSYGMHISRNANLVKDCIQNLFIHLWNSRENLTDTDSIKFYLFKSLKRSLVDELVSQNKYSSIDEVTENYNFEITPSHEFELLHKQTSLEQKEKLQQGINRLTKRQKEAIFLVYYNNLSHQEVASMMSLKVTAVYNLVYNALVTLKKIVGKAFVYILLAYLFFS